MKSFFYVFIGGGLGSLFRFAISKLISISKNEFPWSTFFANLIGCFLIGLLLGWAIKPHTRFTSEVYVLSKDEGGRHTPFFKGYRPQFYFRTTDVTGDVQLPDGVEMVMPGDNIKMTVTLIAPIAMDEGLRFAIREGGRTVGAGVVATIVE